MGTGGTWRAVFRKHVLIPCTGEEVFSEPQTREAIAEAARFVDQAGALV